MAIGRVISMVFGLLIFGMMALVNRHDEAVRDSLSHETTESGQRYDKGEEDRRIADDIALEAAVRDREMHGGARFDGGRSMIDPSRNDD